MTRDEWVMAVLVVAFATLLTAHVALLFGLATRPPRWRAAAAALVAPLAPFWGFRTGMPVRSALWLASAVAYVASWWLARR
jgi:hypothetical protein